LHWIARWHRQPDEFGDGHSSSGNMLFALFNRWWPDFERVRADRRYDDILVRFNSRERTAP